MVQQQSLSIKCDIFTEKKKDRKAKSESGSDSSLISTEYMRQLVDKLQADRHRSSTKNTYFRVWRAFCKFVIRLDDLPLHMEDRLMLFVAYLVDQKKKSGTVKSYISAIKAILEIDEHPVNEDRTTLNAMTRACRLNSEKIAIRFLIRKRLLNVILNKIEIEFQSQPYLETLYKAMFATAYYGLFRIGEITLSPHVVKAVDVLTGVNKPKMMFVLFSSKTHTYESKPQIIKISKIKPKGKSSSDKYCPFKLLQDYVDIRSTEKVHDEPFFVFRDRSPVLAKHLRVVLKSMLKKANIDHR